MQILRDLGATIGALSPTTRVVLVIGAVVAIAAVALVVSLERQTAVPLFANGLQNDQLAEVEEQLAAWSIPFSPQNDNVSVDQRQRESLLLKLSLAGVPHGHVDGSRETLAKIGTLTPQAVVDAQTRSGLEGDLELALRGIEGIDDAIVIVAADKPAIFADDISRDTTASVRVRLKPGARLSREAIAGIRRFVASAVSGLNPERITIVDDRGAALEEDGNGVDAAELERSLQSALDAAFGAGTSIVRVRVEYDPRKDTIHDVRRLPVSGVPILSDRVDERYVAAEKRYSKSARSDDRGSELRDVQTTYAAPRIARIAVAVVVDERRAQQTPEIRALVVAAAGLNLQRGDVVSVQAVPFGRLPAQKKDGWWLAYGAVVTLLPKALVAVVVLVALKWTIPAAAAGCKELITRSEIARMRTAVGGFAPRAVRGALSHEPPHAAAAIISALPAATAAAVLDLYPPEERAAIVRRMSRAHSPLIPDYESVLGDGRVS